jgi:hypothetical protein
MFDFVAMGVVGRIITATYLDSIETRRVPQARVVSLGLGLASQSSGLEGS